MYVGINCNLGIENMVYQDDAFPLQEGPFFHPTDQQSSKAANIIHASFLYRKQLEKEKLKPVSIAYVGELSLHSRGTPTIEIKMLFGQSWIRLWINFNTPNCC